ncbi:A24 family peptidase [Microbacterium sp. M28]|uniref:prepilin peptidase n=1 Tax=Microbacterium sp. M28 TaxID=2962064 RepID=UPI0021F4542C|nr:A24 family peptidase [Microbacterium sp. M28]UYO95952.1 A24 family peptidase [Microbacterium sp. M28]
MPDLLHIAIVIAVHVALIGIGLRLIVIDARTHRLPNRIVLPVGAALLVLVGIEALVTADAAALLRALAGLVILGGFYAVMHLAGGGVGGGDVKLAAVIGIVLGWHGWQALIIGAAAAFVFGAVYVLGLMALRRAHRGTRVAFGPWMIVGAVVGIAMG